MRDYAKVSPHFWLGKTGKQLKQGPETLIVSLYLMTNPHANMLGLYYIPVMFIAHETGLSIEGASKGLQSACEAGFCAYDHETEVVWVYEMAKFQVADELKPADNRCKGIQKDYESIPNNPYLSAFFDKYAQAFCMTVKRGENSQKTSPLEAPPEPLRSQEQEQEQDISSSNAREEKIPIQVPIQFASYKREDHQRYTLLECANQYPIQNDFIELASKRFTEIHSQDLKTMFTNFGDWFVSSNTVTPNTASTWLVKWFSWIQNNKDQVRRAREKVHQSDKSRSKPEQQGYFMQMFAERSVNSEIDVTPDLALMGGTCYA